MAYANGPAGASAGAPAMAPMMPPMMMPQGMPDAMASDDGADADSSDSSTDGSGCTPKPVPTQYEAFSDVSTSVCTNVTAVESLTTAELAMILCDC